MLAQGSTARFDFYVISAAPEEVVLSALDGIVPADHVVGTRFQFQQDSGKIGSLQRVAAGYGKVAQWKRSAHGTSCARSGHLCRRRTIRHSGDVAREPREGFTIAASEAREIAQIAKRTVISDDALSYWCRFSRRSPASPEPDPGAVRRPGLVIQEWDRVRTDWLTIRDGGRDGVIAA